MANSGFLRSLSSSNNDLTLGFVLRQENVQYRAEGNSSLVVRLIRENWILRISKIDVQESKAITLASSSQSCNAIEEEMRKSFAQDVLKLLLGDAFIPNMKIVHLTKEETKSVISAVEKQRPAFRMHKGLSEFPAGSYALLMPDLCTSFLSDKKTLSKDLPKGSKISIEIKPKQGFLDVSEYFLNEIDETLVNNFFVCKFCLKQFLKVQEGPYTVQSNFCPLDLFSGCESRMKHSLKELLKNPQNNLRIFKDGKLIFGGEKLASDLNDLWHYTDGDNTKMIEKQNILFDEDDFISILIKALKWSPNELKVLPLPSPKYSNETSEKCKIKFQKCQYSQECEDEICDSVKENDSRHRLPPGCVLDSILRVQTLGDSCLKTVLPYFNHCNNEFLRLQLSNYFESISSNFIYPSSKIPEYVGETERNPNETDWKFYTRKIWEYLVSLTAKDCSIIITLQPLFEKLENNYEEHILHCRNQDFLMEVKVVDLDPKPLYKIQKNYEGNKKMVFFASTNIIKL